MNSQISYKQKVLEIIRASERLTRIENWETLLNNKTTSLPLNASFDGEQTKNYSEIVDPDEIEKFNDKFGRAFMVTETIPSDVSIAEHTHRFADILTSLTLPDCSHDGEQMIIFHYQDENCDKSSQLFELKMKPGQEYQLKDPLPLVSTPFTKIWFTGSSELLITYVRVSDLKLRKSLMYSPIGIMHENWEFLPEAPQKYFIHNGALFPVEIRQQYFDTQIKPKISILL